MVQQKSDNVEDLLNNWEEVYKKGLMTFWLLLFLNDRPAYAYEASEEIGKLSQNTIKADENSMYRALNRFETLSIVKSELKQSSIGPSRKYYSLTKKGIALLSKFIKRNILVFQNHIVAKQIQAVLQKADSPQKEEK
jgi:PadR family transcriptional regulator, regulatory protein PadR